MAASQSRLLQLTRRGNDVRCELTKLANNKTALARDMQKVTRKYQEALNSKTLKYVLNGGENYVDINYANLMYPNSLITDSAYVLTDMDDKVVLDSKYAELAKLFSPNGEPGCNWESQRANILSALTGVSPSDIINADTYYQTYLRKKEIVEATTDPEQKKVAEESMNNALDFYNSLFDAETKRKIKRYEDIFTTIEDKGWKCYDHVAEAGYVDQMLQNNMFNFTKVDRELGIDNGNLFFENSYHTEMALNCPDIAQLSNAEVRDAALVEYEAQKSLINEKEDRIDLRMTNLETQASAIKQTISAIKSLIDNNIQQNMTTFNA